MQLRRTHLVGDQRALCGFGGNGVQERETEGDKHQERDGFDSFVVERHCSDVDDGGGVGIKERRGLGK